MSKSASTRPPAAPNIADTTPPERVLAALTAADCSTAAELADATGLARSTVSKALNALSIAGSALRETGGHHGRVRQPDRWYPVGTATAPEPATRGAEDATPDATDREPAIDTTNGPGTTADSASHAESATESVPEADSAPDTAPPIPAAPATPAQADAAPHGADTALGAPDTADPAGNADATGPAPSPEASAAPQTLAPSQPRLGRGALRGMVLDHLTDHPGQAFSPAEIGRALGGRSPGAVTNACDKLTADGRVELACEKPRRYRTTTSGSK